MSRSAQDATRFTQTAPHAFKSNGPSSSSSSRAAATGRGGATPKGSQYNQPPMAEQPVAASGTGETPSQRVGRLRAEHLKRRAAQLSAWDKTVIVGRRVSNRLHGITIMGLIGLSVVTAGVSLFSFVDMLMYNNRKKKDFAESYRRLWEQRHEDALRAETMGTATETQLILIKQEREAQTAWAQKQDRTYWQRIKGAFSTQGLSNDARGTQSWKQKQDFLESHGIGFIGERQADGQQAVGGVVAALNEQRRVVEEELDQSGGARGGPLDQMAHNVASKATAELGSTSWTNWFRRGQGSRSAEV